MADFSAKGWSFVYYFSLSLPMLTPVTRLTFASPNEYIWLIDILIQSAPSPSNCSRVMRYTIYGINHIPSLMPDGPNLASSKQPATQSKMLYHPEKLFPDGRAIFLGLS